VLDTTDSVHVCLWICFAMWTIIQICGLIAAMLRSCRQDLDLFDGKDAVLSCSLDQLSGDTEVTTSLRHVCWERG
jgi:hypothetical protein